MNMVE